MTALVAIEAVVILLLAVLVAGLLRSHAEILRRLHALGAGEDLDRRPSFTPVNLPTALGALTTVVGQTPRGGTATVALAGSRGLTLLAFLSTGCTSCRAFWQRPSAWPADVRPVIVTKGPSEESPSQLAGLAPEDVTTIMSSEAWDAFKVPATPYFVLVDAASGQVAGEGAAGSWIQLSDLLGRAIGDRRRPDTSGRTQDTDEELTRAGIQPGDPTLYRRPDQDPP
jgi:hypothetical protein